MEQEIVRRRHPAVLLAWTQDLLPFGDYLLRAKSVVQLTAGNPMVGEPGSMH